jgi:hypothetical protein
MECASEVDRPLRRAMLLSAASPPRFSIEQELLDPPSDSALTRRFRETGTFPKQRSQIRVDQGRAADAGQIGGRL